MCMVQVVARTVNFCGVAREINRFKQMPFDVELNWNGLCVCGCVNCYLMNGIGFQSQPTLSHFVALRDSLSHSRNCVRHLVPFFIIHFISNRIYIINHIAHN